METEILLLGLKRKGSSRKKEKTQYSMTSYLKGERKQKLMFRNNKEDDNKSYMKKCDRGNPY